MGDVIRVGLADLNVCRAPDRITTLGLGSCIGLVLYSMRSTACGMVHVMLPDSSIMRNTENPAKFADTGVKLLVDRLAAMGLRRTDLCAKMAGGAKMFSIRGRNDVLNIGDRNAEAVRAELEKLRIPIVASDCGENFGRTIEFDPETRKLKITSIGKDVKYI